LRVWFTNDAGRRALENGLRSGFIVPAAILYDIRESVFGELPETVFEYVSTLEVTLVKDRLY